jgi:dTDP-glucose 4,6-dehydratase
VIPTIIGQIAAGQTHIQLGDTTPTRDFNYVADTCQGMMALMATDNTIGETVNISSNYEISVQDTLELIKRLMGSSVEFVQDAQRIRPKDSEVFRLWGDNTKLKTLTGYSPTTSLQSGLQQTIDWFVQPQNLKAYKTGHYNV